MSKDELMASLVDCDALCEVCDRHISKNLSPSNPACEGRWCDEAFEIWKELNT